MGLLLWSGSGESGHSGSGESLPLARSKNLAAGFEGKNKNKELCSEQWYIYAQQGVPLRDTQDAPQAFWPASALYTAD